MAESGLVYNWKRSASRGAGCICLACGRLRNLPLYCEGCGLAVFCGPECQQAAHPCHKGACEVAREAASRQPHSCPPAILPTVKELVGLVGRSCNPVAAKKFSPDSAECLQVLHFLEGHPEVVDRKIADYLLSCCRALQNERLCCNPHLFSWCLLDGCMRLGGVQAFAANAGFIAAGDCDQAMRWHMEWLRTRVLPLQEMFGQVGMGRFWDDTPAFPEPSLALSSAAAGCQNKRRFSADSYSSASTAPRQSCDQQRVSREVRRSSMARSMSLAAAWCS